MPTRQLKVSEQKYVTFLFRFVSSLLHCPCTHIYRSIAAFSCDLSAPNSVEVLESLC